MARLIYSSDAQKDLNQISVYVAERSGSRAIARNFVVSIRDRCDRLASLPGTLGTARPDLARDLRSTPHRGYVIYFRYAPDALEIVNVLDARRDVLAHFEGVPDSD